MQERGTGYPEAYLYQVPDIPFSAWHCSNGCRHPNISTALVLLVHRPTAPKCQMVQWRRTDNEMSIGLSFSCPGQLPWLHPLKKTPWDRSLGGYLATGSEKATDLASRMRGEATWDTKPPFSFMNYLDWEYYNTDLKTCMNTNWYLRLGHGNVMTSLLNVDWAWVSVYLAEDQAVSW